MKYFCYNEYIGKTISSQEIKISCGSLCDGYTIDDTQIMILYNGLPICLNTSYNGTKCFCSNLDNNGQIRGQIINEINDLLHNNVYKLINSSLANSYRRVEIQDVWLWNRKFYDASLEDLNIILNMLKN